MDGERIAAPNGFPVDLSGPSRGPFEDVAHRQALRLSFSYEGPHIQLLLREAIEMIVPPSAPLIDDPYVAAFWYELHDEEDAPLYRQRNRDPFDSSVEIRTDDPEHPLARVDSGRTAGTFTLLLPQLPEAQSLVLYAPPPLEEGRDIDRMAAHAPVELARFPLGTAVDSKMIAEDTIPPTTVSDALAAYPSAAVIHLRAFDNMGDVARTIYRLDDGDEHQGLTVTVEEPGRHRLLFWSVDLAGNVEVENVVTFTVGRPVGAV